VRWVEPFLLERREERGERREEDRRTGGQERGEKREENRRTGGQEDRVEKREEPVTEPDRHSPSFVHMP
jgi:hypothetical protein